MAQPIEAGPDDGRPHVTAGRSVAEMRAAYERSFSLCQDVLLHWEGLTVQWALGLREIGSHIGRNADANIRALFDLAERQMQARSASEIAALQGRFLQEQSERMAAQFEELESLVSSQVRTLQDEFRQGFGR